MAPAASSPSAGRVIRSGRLRATVAGCAGLVLGLTACGAEATTADASTGDSSSGAVPSTAAEAAPAPGAPDSASSATLDLGAPDDAPAERPQDGEEPLLTAPPDEFSEVGTLVQDFPVDLLPIPADAVILVTSAVPVGDADVQEVSLNLRTTAPADEVWTLYADALAAAGFTHVPSTTAPSELTVEATFTRSGGDELLSVGILDADGARTVTIGGRVHTDG